MTPTPAEVAAVLERAVEELQDNGWRQGPRTMADIWAGRRRGIPISDALLFAATYPGIPNRFGVMASAEYAIAEWIGEHPDTGPVSWQDADTLAVSVDAWNDAPGRTIRDVVRACYGAARLAWPRRHRGPRTVPEVLGAAADLIATHGWQRDGRRLAGQMTIREAIHAAAGEYGVGDVGAMAHARAWLAWADLSVMPQIVLVEKLRDAAAAWQAPHQTTQDGAA